MSDIEDVESEYDAYDSAKDTEGGLHSGRSDPSRGLVVTLAIVVVLLVLGGIVLALIPR